MLIKILLAHLLAVSAFAQPGPSPSPSSHETLVCSAEVGQLCIPYRNAEEIWSMLDMAAIMRRTEEAKSEALALQQPEHFSIEFPPALPLSELKGGNPLQFHGAIVLPRATQMASYEFPSATKPSVWNGCEFHFLSSDYVNPVSGTLKLGLPRSIDASGEKRVILPIEQPGQLYEIECVNRDGTWPTTADLNRSLATMLSGIDPKSATPATVSIYFARDQLSKEDRELRSYGGTLGKGMGGGMLGGFPGMGMGGGFGFPGNPNPAPPQNSDTPGAGGAF